jgi:hypothetical protein
MTIPNLKTSPETRIIMASDSIHITMHSALETTIVWNYWPFPVTLILLMCLTYFL